MCDLLFLYRFAIGAAVLLAPALALLGCQIAARDKSVQALCVSQGAMFGAVVGLFVGHYFDEKALTVPIVFLGAVSALVLGERVIARRSASKNTLLTALFATYLALGYLFSACFPGVENHMTQVFFGDLATLSNRESMFAIALATAVLGYLIHGHTSMTRESFLGSVLGMRSVSSYAGIDRFTLLSGIFVAICVQLLGFLFTVSMLFLPTSLALIAGNIGLRRHLILACLVASLSAGLGFHLSLHFTLLPTVPLIVISLVILGGVSSTGWRFLKRQRRP